MIYCKNPAKMILLLGLIFLFGAYGSFAASETLHYDIGDQLGPGVADGIVNFNDLAVLANEWLERNSEPNLLKADFNGDGVVDSEDLASLFTEWLKSEPLASIDLIAPDPAEFNTPVTFTGHGNASFVNITAYQWKIDDVNISNEATFTTSTLAKGLHTVSFAVQDDTGAWSVPKTQALVIVDRKDIFVSSLEDANFCRDSVAFLDGKEYAPGEQRFSALAVSNVSDCIIYGAEDVLWVSPVILSPKCSAGGYIYATDTNNNNIYRSSDGINWEQMTIYLTGAYRIFGTQSGAIIVARSNGHNVILYRSVVGGHDLSDWQLPPASLTLPASDSDCAVVNTWNFHQAQNGTICLGEYGTHNYNYKKSRIYRSVDDGISFTQVYDEPDFVYHSHRIMKHEATGRWVNVYGDGAPMNKVVKSDDDGVTWSTLDPQPDNNFNPVDFYDYGDPTNLLYGADCDGDFIGTFDVITRKITPLYKDGDRYNQYVFAIFYYDGVYYAGTSNGSSTKPVDCRTAILVSSDLVHWAVYHQFRSGEQGVNKFLGVWGGRIHGIVTLSDKYTWRHFSISPATVTLANGLCLDPATTNMLDNPQDSSVEVSNSHWYSVVGTRTRITTDALHGTGCLRIDGNSGIETVYPLSKPVTAGDTYSCRVWLKANGMNLTGRARWYVSGTSRYGPESYFCLSQDSWTEIVLPPVTIGVGESSIMIFICPRSSNWSGPYSFFVDAAQYEAGPPSRWQVGGQPRAIETLSKSITVGETWTDVIMWAPECRSEWYKGFGNQYIKTWYKDPDNYLEFYFDPSDSTFNLQATVSGIVQRAIKTSPYTFYRNGVIRAVVRCNSSSLILSISAASAYQHTYGAPVDFLRSATFISKTGDHNGTSMISHTLHSDVFYFSILPDGQLP